MKVGKRKISAEKNSENFDLMYPKAWRSPCLKLLMFKYGTYFWDYLYQTFQVSQIIREFHGLCHYLTVSRIGV